MANKSHIREFKLNSNYSTALEKLEMWLERSGYDTDIIDNTQETEIEITSGNWIIGSAEKIVVAIKKRGDKAIIKTENNWIMANLLGLVLGVACLWGLTLGILFIIFVVKGIESFQRSQKFRKLIPSQLINFMQTQSNNSLPSIFQ